MKIQKNQVLKNVGKRSIVYDTYFKEEETKLPIVIFCHGYKGFKDWGAWHLVAKAFAEAGFFFVKFNFSHNGGTVTQPIDFPDLEAFSDNNFSMEMDDLERMLHLITTQNFNNNIDVNQIFLIGHSRGGGTVLIKAEENNLIKKVATWAGVSDFGTRFKEDSESFKNWKETGITYVENGRTKQQMPHKFQFYKDFKLNKKRFNIERAVNKLKIPQLIIHGSDDETVSLAEAKSLHNWNKDSKLEIIEGGNHVFGASHPWKDDMLPIDLQKATNMTIQFFK